MKKSTFSEFCLCCVFVWEIDFRCFFPCFPLLKSLPFWRARFASFGSIFGVVLMVYATFWLPKPSRRPSRTHPKKTSKIDAYFYWFGAVLAIPGVPKIDEKQLRWYPTALLFLLPKRFCCEVGLEDAILDEFGFQNVNFGSQHVNFGRDVVLFFTCFGGLH